MQDIQDINTDSSTFFKKKGEVTLSFSSEKDNDSLTKPKKQRSQKQIESFEKTMRLRRENIEKRKEEKLLQSAKLLLEKNEIPKNNIPKTNKAVYQSSSSEKDESINESSSSEEEEIIVVKSKPKPKPKPKKKTRKTIIFESSSEESSSDEEEERYIAPPKNKSRVKRLEPEYNLPPPQHHLEPKDFRVYFI
jgi:hypothetical protein